MPSGGDCPVHTHPRGFEIIQALDLGDITASEAAIECNTTEDRVYACIKEHVDVKTNGDEFALAVRDDTPLPPATTRELSESDVEKAPLEFLARVLDDMKYKYLQVQTLNIRDPIDNRIYLNFVNTMRVMILDLAKVIGAFNQQTQVKYQQINIYSDKLAGFLASSLCATCAQKAITFMADHGKDAT